MTKNIKNDILDYCNKLGLDTIGFVKLRTFDEITEKLRLRAEMGTANEFEEKQIELRTNPEKLFAGGKTIITIAFPYLFNKEKTSGPYFSAYTLGMDYHRVIGIYLKKVCEFIENLGGRCACFSDNNALPERYIASLSGIGFLGKNNMLITKKYGSYVFLGEIITDLEIEEDEPMKQECGQCSLCINACPTKAIGSTGNSNICLSYITQKKNIEDEWFARMDGRLFGCDSCQAVCPYNREINLSSIKEFQPFDFMMKPDIYEIASMKNSLFKERYYNTAAAWRGKSLLQRNAMIAISSMYGLEGLNNIDIKTIGSPYVLDYYHRLLRLFKL